MEVLPDEKKKKKKKSPELTPGGTLNGWLKKNKRACYGSLSRKREKGRRKQSFSFTICGKEKIEGGESDAIHT